MTESRFPTAAAGTPATVPPRAVLLELDTHGVTGVIVARIHSGGRISLDTQYGDDSTRHAYTLTAAEDARVAALCEAADTARELEGTPRPAWHRNRAPVTVRGRRYQARAYLEPCPGTDGGCRRGWHPIGPAWDIGHGYGPTIERDDTGGTAAPDGARRAILAAIGDAVGKLTAERADTFRAAVAASTLDDAARQLDTATRAHADAVRELEAATAAHGEAVRQLEAVTGGAS
jgi:hypothetical protein